MGLIDNYPSYSINKQTTAEHNDDMITAVERYVLDADPRVDVPIQHPKDQG